MTTDTLELPRSAKNVMMSAHALCPTDLPHPERMQWMAEYFMKHLGARQCEYALGVCTRPGCADQCQAKVASAIRNPGDLPELYLNKVTHGNRAGQTIVVDMATGRNIGVVMTTKMLGRNKE